MKILILTNQSGEQKGLFDITSKLIQKISQTAPNLLIKNITTNDLRINTQIKNSNILITSSPVLLNTENARNLKWIHVTSAGLNKIPDFLKNSNILITNSSGVHPIPIAEHVFGLAIMLSRKLFLAYKIQLERKEWVRDYTYFAPAELYGKTLLIVGMGKIGERIGKIGEAFGMEVWGVVRDLNKQRDVKTELFEIKDLPKLVKKSDFIINALPGSSLTKGIFNLKLFRQFKKESFFINIGRGITVVENDLITALKRGLIAGAGLDVFEIEPLPKTSPLWTLNNVLITPHYSGWTPKYTERMIDIFIENLKAYLKNQKMPNLVDKRLDY